MRRASRIGIPRAARFRKPHASSADYTHVLPALCSKLRASPARFERTRHAFAVAPRMRPYELPPISTTAICGSRLSGAHRATRQWQTLSAVLICAYFVAGVFGRFPWKADEPYSFGIVWDMVERHSWLVPHITGEPFVEKPPLVYWLGALFAKLLPMVPAHESSRGAISLLALATVIPLYVAAEYLHSEAAIFVRQLEFRDASGGRMSIARSVTARTYALLAIVLMTGTLGIPEHVHKLSADLGQLAGAMLGLCGLIKVGADSVADRSADRAAHSRVAAAALFGTGVGVAFMSKGLFVPGTLVATWLCCAFIPAYRRRTTAVVATTALASALPWMLVWPILLYHASPTLFGEWLWDQNFGRFLGQVALGGNNVSFASKVLSAVVMGFPPVLLCASVAVRILVLPGVGPARRWTLIRDAPAHACIAIYLAILLLALGVSASMRDVYLLPAVPAMILLGAGVDVENARFFFASQTPGGCRIWRGCNSRWPDLACIGDHRDFGVVALAADARRPMASAAVRTGSPLACDNRGRNSLDHVVLRVAPWSVGKRHHCVVLGRDHVVDRSFRPAAALDRRRAKL